MSLKQKILSHIESFFEGVEAIVLAFTSSLAHAIAENGGKVLVDAATAAVAAAEATGGSGKDKLAGAVASVVAVLEREGIPVAMNAVNGAIEAAVASLAKPAAAAPDTPVAGV